jgi:peptide/nickel transport system permease protein
MAASRSDLAMGTLGPKPGDSNPVLAAVKRTLPTARARIAAYVVLLYVLFAIVSIVWSPSGNAISDSVLTGPSAQHPFGTDDLGRDVLMRVIAGGGPIILASLAAGITSVAIGSALGAALAYRGGVVEFATMRGIDVLLSIPLVVIALLLAALLPSGYLFLYLLASAVQVLPVTRVARGIFADVLHRDFVVAAALRGESVRYLIVREALPNVIGPMFVELGLRWNFSLLLIASLNFLGVGIQPPTADWGVMLYEGRTFLTSAPWIALIPAALIACLAIAINFTADGIARAVGYDQAAGGRG